MSSQKEGPSPRKRARRGFFIKNLIGQVGGQQRQRNAPRRHARIIGSEKRYNNKFKTLCVKTTILIEQVPENPEGFLRALFQHCIDEALDDAHQKGIRPDRLGATISSPLLDPDIWIGIREITTNTAHAILNRFLLVSQSKPKSLWGEPFSVSVTTINRAALPTTAQIRGRGRTKRLHNVHHQVNRGSLILVNNPPGDNRCLLYALELTRIHNTYQGTPLQFHRYLYQQLHQQAQDVTALMQAAGIPFGEPDYEAGPVVPRVVDYWNRKYADQGQRFKVFIFGAMGQYEPEYTEGADDFTHPICLYHANDHFDGVRCNVGAAIFGREKYCFSCLRPYNNGGDHTSKCKARCV